MKLKAPIVKNMVWAAAFVAEINTLRRLQSELGFPFTDEERDSLAERAAQHADDIAAIFERLNAKAIEAYQRSVIEEEAQP